VKFLKNEQKKQLLAAGTLIVVLLIFLGATNPQKVSLGLLAVPLILIALIVYLLARFALTAIPSLAAHKHKANGVAVVLSFMITSLLIFQSIGQLALGDITIVFFLGIVAIFYIVKLF
jgi:hypothetical protein